MNNSGRFRWLAGTTWCRFWIFLLSSSSGLMIVGSARVNNKGLLDLGGGLSSIECHISSGRSPRPRPFSSLCQSLSSNPSGRFYDKCHETPRRCFQKSLPGEHGGRTEQNRTNRRPRKQNRHWPADDPDAQADGISPEMKDGLCFPSCTAAVVSYVEENKLQQIMVLMKTSPEILGDYFQITLTRCPLISAPALRTFGLTGHKAKQFNWPD